MISIVMSQMMQDFLKIASTLVPQGVSAFCDTIPYLYNFTLF